MKYGTITVAIAVATMALAGLGASSERGVKDSEISLSKTAVFDVPSPDPVRPDTGEPGEGTLMDRAFPGAPPLIPHGVGDFLPLTRTDNACIDCHQTEEKIEGEPTPIPRSHFEDLRNSPGTMGDAVVGARFNCVACHVPQTDAPPLVGNRFQP